MAQPTLFGDEPAAPPEPGPRQPAPPWLVAELVALGVPPVTAGRYTMRQAFGVKAKLERKRAADQAAEQAAAAAGRSPERAGGYREPLANGATLPDRWCVRDLLAEDVAAVEAGTVHPEVFFRGVRGSLYVFSTDELVRVARGLINLLGETDGRTRVGRAGPPDAGRTGDLLPDPEPGGDGGVDGVGAGV